jgi:hypothetical protein
MINYLLYDAPIHTSHTFHLVGLQHYQNIQGKELVQKNVWGSASRASLLLPIFGDLLPEHVLMCDNGLTVSYCLPTSR